MSGRYAEFVRQFHLEFSGEVSFLRRAAEEVAVLRQTPRPMQGDETPADFFNKELFSY
jgi:hypothetical protein